MYLRALIISVLFFPTTSVLATERKLTENELRKLQDDMKQRDFLTLDFVQSGYNKKRDKTTTRAKGTGYFSLPDKFHWNISWPSRLIWLSTGEKLIQHVPSESVATWFPLDNSTGPAKIIGYVTNLKTLLNDYKLQNATKNGHMVYASLGRKNSRNPFEVVEIFYNSKNNVVTQLKLKEKSGNVTYYKFTNPRYSKVSDQKFKIPPETRMVKGI